MKKGRSDLITEGIREKIQHDSWDHNEEVKPKRSKWIKWLLDIINKIVTPSHST
jgi:metal-responsive CopG/Arc/MetJ family transcriptional regulator